MTTYRERLKAGHHDANNQQAEPDLDPDNLPARHAALDELATARGITWSSDNMNVADKQEQLRSALIASAPANTTSDDLTGRQ